MGAVTESQPEAPEPIIDVIGHLDERGTVALTSVARVTAYPPSRAGARTDLVVELVDNGGQTIAAGRAYAPLAHGHGDEGPTAPFTFVATLPDAHGAAALVLTRANREVFRRDAPPREPALRNFRAEVTADGEAADLSWDFEASTDVEPQFWLQVSADGGDTWRGVTTGLRGSRATVGLGAVPGGQAVLRLQGHDGFYTVMATTRLDLPPRTPTAVILHPTENATFQGTGPIRLWGVGLSAQDGALTGNALKWSSDVEGSLPAGQDVLARLAPGQHRIGLLATDSGGRTAEAHVTVTVQKPPLNCVDFSASPPAPGPGFYPPGLLVSGCRLDVYGSGFSTAGCVVAGSPMVYSGPGVPAGPHTLIKTEGGFTGLDCGFGLQATLPYPVPYAELTLVSFAQPASLEACDIGGTVVGSATMSGPGGTAQTLAFHGAAISRIVVTPPSNESLLLSICF
jgi:hypothetical protein